MKPVLVVILTAAVAVLLLSAPPAAQAQAPEIVSMFPEDGDILAEEPAFLPATPTTADEPIPAESRYGLQLCFAASVDIRDNDKGGLHDFTVTSPDDTVLALRIVFQPDGLGVVVFPGIAPEPFEGEWTFEWLIRDVDSLEEAPGSLRFQIQEDGDPVPTEPAAPCGGTPTPQREDTPTTGATTTPTTTDDEDSPDQDDDDGSDALIIALIIVGAVAAAAVVAAALYIIRRRSRSPE